MSTQLEKERARRLRLALAEAESLSASLRGPLEAVEDGTEIPGTAEERLKAAALHLPHWWFAGYVDEEKYQVMRAIETKYLGPTNTRRSRIVATDGDSRIIIPIPANETLHREALHRAAAQALADKMKWTGHMASGITKRGYVFVFMD